MYKSYKKLKNPEEYLLPFETTFPVDVHIQVNNVHSYFPAGKKVQLTIGEYDTIQHSAEYAKYL